MRNILAGFIIDRQSRALSKGTVRYYLDELNRFCDWLDAIGVISLDEITANILRKYLLHLETTRNPGGIHASYRAIRAYLFWYEDEFEPENWKNPIRKVHPPKVSRQPLPGIAVDDVLKMVTACRTDQSKRDKAILLTLLDTGCRASELTALSIQDMDFITGAVRVQHGKGDKPRTVFVGSRCRRSLRAYIKTRSDIRPNTPLFVTDEGDRIKYMGLVKIIKRRALDAGIDTPGLHDFRRAFAVEMLRGGCDLARLAELMGHTSLEMLKRYLHLVTDDLQAAHAQASPVDRAF